MAKKQHAIFFPFAACLPCKIGRKFSKRWHKISVFESGLVFGKTRRWSRAWGKGRNIKVCNNNRKRSSVLYRLYSYRMKTWVQFNNLCHFLPMCLEKSWREEWMGKGPNGSWNLSEHYILMNHLKCDWCSSEIELLITKWLCLWAKYTFLLNAHNIT